MDAGKKYFFNELTLNLPEDYEEKDFEWFRTLHSMAFKQLNLTTKSVMKDRNYKELGKKLQIKEFLNANNQIEDNGQSMQKNPFMRIIELARNNMVNINTQWRRIHYFYFLIYLNFVSFVVSKNLNSFPLFLCFHLKK